MENIIVAQDGCPVSDLIIEEFKLTKQDSYLKNDKNILDFVGVVYRYNKLLFVFPKTFYKSSLQFSSSTLTNDMRLVLESILLYQHIKKTKGIHTQYAGEDDLYDATFPFHYFFEVYRYYKRYGLYFNEFTDTKVGNSGKINWKKTISNGDFLISKGNIIYNKFVVNKKQSEQSLLTDCMIYIINYTSNIFGNIMDLEKINHKIREPLMFEDYILIIYELKTLLSKTFNDSLRSLIHNMICFFSDLNDVSKGGSVPFKIKYYNLIWQDMVETYLNDRLLSVTKSELKFSNKKVHKFDFKSKNFSVDESKNKFVITPDHYYIRDNIQYIFDSKYTDTVSDKLDYKQLSYHYLLNNQSDISETISYLFHPGDSKQDVYFSLNSLFGIEKIIIGECSLNIRDVMKNYVNII